VPFREFAFTMTVGVLIDSFLVRTLLVPSLMTLFGRTSHWPGRRTASLPEPTPAADPVPAARVDAAAMI
jgi:RND superfamily putative drug exporter